MGAKATLTVERKKGEVSIEDLAKKKSGLVKVGFLSGAGKHPGSDATFAEIGAYLEYGTDGSQGRRGINEYAPFRTWLAKKRTEYKGAIEDVIREYLLGKMSLDQVVKALGRMGVNDLQDQMKTMVTPENEESTQLAKGAKTGSAGTKINNPTIDTGVLRQTVSYGEV